MTRDQLFFIKIIEWLTLIGSSSILYVFNTNIFFSRIFNTNN